jgi:hypothetical protein
MKIRIIEQGRNRVAVTLNDAGECELLDFLQSMPSNYKSSAKGFKALFQRYALGGRQMLTDATFHEASREDDIWEFIKGQLRVYCFRDGDDKLVILSHGILKKTQQAKKQDVERAARLRERYLKAKENGTLEEANQNE